MKKTNKILVSALALTLVCLVLVACGHIHTYETKWSYNDTHHWIAGTCEHENDKDAAPNEEYAAHIMGEPVVVDATCTTDGSRTTACKICGYKVVETIPANGTHVYDGGKTELVVDNGALYTQKICDNCGEGGEKTAVENAKVVTNTAEAQAALDAHDSTTLIYFAAGNYETLYIRTDDSLSTKLPYGGTWAGGGGTLLYREIENLTLLGADGAILDGFKVESFTYTPGGNVHSTSQIEHMIAAISLKNVTFKNLEFSGALENALSLTNNVAVDGLVFDGCTMNDADKDSRLLYVAVNKSDVSASGEVVMPAACKNITIKNCVVDGAHQVTELRGTENVTIEGNTFKNIAMQTLLINANDPHFTGTITIKDNTVDTISERFIRMNNVDGDVVITGNKVTNYTGADEDIIKVTNVTGTVTCEGNEVPDGALITLPEA